MKTQICIAVSISLAKLRGLEKSLYQILQIFSITSLEKVPILQVFEAFDSQSFGIADHHSWESAPNRSYSITLTADPISIHNRTPMSEDVSLLLHKANRKTGLLRREGAKRREPNKSKRRKIGKSTLSKKRLRKGLTCFQGLFSLTNGTIACKSRTALKYWCPRGGRAMQ